MAFTPPSATKKILYKFSVMILGEFCAEDTIFHYTGRLAVEGVSLYLPIMLCGSGGLLTVQLKSAPCLSCAKRSMPSDVTCRGFLSKQSHVERPLGLISPAKCEVTTHVVVSTVTLVDDNERLKRV